jgi:hypothetical protein
MNHCRVIGTCSPGGAGRYVSAVGVRVDIGTVRNTLIAGNHNDDYCPGYDGAGGVLIGGGTLENCTIVANTNMSNSTYGRGVHQTGGTIRNCIVYGNGNRGSTVTGEYVMVSGTIEYSLAPELTPGAPNNNLNVNPLFKNAVAGDFTLDRGSPCRETGITLGGMAGTVDLNGNRRVQGNAVDMGCYEASPIAGTVLLLR